MIKNSLYLAFTVITGLFLAACQAPVVNPNSPGKVALPQVTPKEATKDTPQKTPTTIKTPRKVPPKKQPPRRASSKDILKQQRAQRRNTRRTSTTRATGKRKDGRNIPAFNNLMKIGKTQLRSGKLNSAQQTFTKAQRLGPQSPAVYMYLSEIAIKKRQGTQAENLARRGLLVSRSKRYDKALWTMVLISGKMRNRSAVIKEAQRNLQRLK